MKPGRTICARSCGWRRRNRRNLPAVILDGRTLQSTPASGQRAGYDGYKRKKGSKGHAAVDTLGHLLALKVTPANAQERAQVGELAQAGAGSDRRRAQGSSRPRGSPSPRRQTGRGEKRFRPAPPTLGGGALPLPGPPAFVVWPAIMNGCPPTSPAFTGWLFLLLCLTLSSIKAHDTL